MNRRINPILHYAGRLFLWLMGWEILNRPPDLKKYILIAGPHTALIDTVYALAISWALHLSPTVFIKHTMFRWPIGWLFRRVGGVPIDRTAPQGTVAQVAAEFERRDEWVLLIAPDGRRIKEGHHRDHRWKTGFYHIAMAANLPIVAGRADFKHKEVGFSAPLIPTGNKEDDIAELKSFVDAGYGRRYKQLGIE